MRSVQIFVVTLLLPAILAFPASIIILDDVDAIKTSGFAPKNKTSPPNVSLASQGKDCAWAEAHIGKTYMDCAKTTGKDSDHIDYKISKTGFNYFFRFSDKFRSKEYRTKLVLSVLALTGTGQKQTDWVKGIYDNIKDQCGGNANLYSTSSVQKNSFETLAFTMSNGYGNPKKGENSLVLVYGVVFSFTLKWPWAEEDADMKCISTAVRKATCDGVAMVNGHTCRDKKETEWKNTLKQPEVLESHSLFGPA
ncbi:uncharacterized protein BCR38DRAFT_483175 [Pseudomassariella vexata]|uniref:Uncharacterized protein n=1 Tax=Pseudomassariella vexata TaxID=1141098 RepID=A0A1Y2E7P2_9PEZI|nr:uncharacterized protein BCR38DRAFT_483175 [Pseudomassariella vexata]ORY67559.1 hypothetical protein BCR38DRAFT_483175 [Pseudomassariella vexata]